MLLYPTTRLSGEVNFPIRHRDTTQRIKDCIRAPRGQVHWRGNTEASMEKLRGRFLIRGECKDIQSQLSLGKRV